MELRPPILGSGCSGAFLDVRTQILTIPGEYEFDDQHEKYEFWVAKYIHESGHWVRFHGSTAGIYLTLLRSTRDLTALAAFHRLSETEADRVASWRESGRPVWSFERGYSLEPAGELFGLGGQFWLDLYYAHEVLFEADAVSAIRWHLEDALQMSLADVWLWAGGAPLFAEYPGNEVARSVLIGPFGPSPLTTRLLWECASTLDEYEYARKSTGPVAEELRSMAVETLKHTEYGLPMRLAATIFERPISPNLLYFLIDFATNPPLPFLVRAPETIRWAEFYPPSRFTAACESLRADPRIESLVDQADAAGVEEARQRLSARTNLRYGEDAFPVVPPPLDSMLAEDDLSHLYPLLFVSKYLLSVRVSDPFSIMRNDSPVRVFFAPEEKQLPFGTTLGYSLPYQPFVMSFGGRLQKNQVISELHVARFMRHILWSCALDELINGNGPLPQDHMPPPFQTSQAEFWANTGADLVRLTGVKWASHVE